MPPPGASEKASHDPPGDHETDPTGSSNAVTWSGHPPALDTVKICGTPVRFETKAMRFPSGEKLGPEQNPILPIAATERSTSSELPGAAAGSGRVRTRRAKGSLFIFPPGRFSA